MKLFVQKLYTAVVFKLLRRKFFRRYYRKKLAKQKLEINKMQYDLILPLGRSCHTSMHLRALGLQNRSYPLDWLITTGNHLDMLETKVNYYINGFENFLNLEDLEVRFEDAEHIVVINKLSCLQFGHDFHGGKTVEESFPEIKEKYNRRIARVMKNINASSRVLMVFMQNTWDHFNATTQTMSDSQLATFAYRLNKAYPGKKIDVAVFEHDGSKKLLEYSTHIVNENARKYFSNHLFKEKNEKLGTILSIKRIFEENYELLETLEENKKTADDKINCL